MSRALYLNNFGDKWVIPGRMRFASMEQVNGEIRFVFRTADYFEQFGNFASYSYRVGGKRVKSLADDFFKAYDEKSREWVPVINRTDLKYGEADVYMKMLGGRIE